MGSKVPYALHKNSCYFFGEKLEELKKNSKRTSKELGTEKERQKNKKGTSEELRTKKEHLKFLFCSSGGAGVSPATIPFGTRAKGSIVFTTSDKLKLKAAGVCGIITGRDSR